MFDHNWSALQPTHLIRSGIFHNTSLRRYIPHSPIQKFGSRGFFTSGALFFVYGVSDFEIVSTNSQNIHPPSFECFPRKLRKENELQTTKKVETTIPSETELISELKANGIKFTEEDIIFITKDKTGQTVWLEKGNSSAGLDHILNGDGKTLGHASDFENAFGITRDEIPTLLKEVITNGQVVSNTIKIKNGKQGYERIYYYDGNHYVLTGIGTNGFVVSAYPIEY